MGLILALASTDDSSDTYSVLTCALGRCPVNLFCAHDFSYYHSPPGGPSTNQFLVKCRDELSSARKTVFLSCKQKIARNTVEMWKSTAQISFSLFYCLSLPSGASYFCPLFLQSFLPSLSLCFSYLSASLTLSPSTRCILLLSVCSCNLFSPSLSVSLTCLSVSLSPVWRSFTFVSSFSPSVLAISSPVSHLSFCLCLSPSPFLHLVSRHSVCLSVSLILSARLPFQLLRNIYFVTKWTSHFSIGRHHFLVKANDSNYA